ncbi:MAG: SRPBCC family protein [Planctomycetota bacterium]|nr:SRPBCC family protein [Planctomycetota bacterium]
MKPEVEASIRAEWRAARARPGAAGGGFQVAGDVYNDSELAERERHLVFARAWLPICRASQVEAPGSYRTADLAGTPIAVVRSLGSGQLRAFLNVCPHRGNQLLRAAEGSLADRDGVVACAYHGAAFDAGGQDEGDRQRPFGAMVPGSGGFQGSELGCLEALAVESHWGWVWVRRSGTMSLADFLGEELADELAGWDLLRAALHRSHSFEGAFDWKVGVEAFLESMHLPTIHRRTAAPLLDHMATAQAQLGSHSRMSTPFRMPGAYGPDGLLGSAAAEAGVGLFPGLNEVQRTSNFSYLLFPSTVLNLLPTHFTLFRILPLGLERCRVEYELYAAPTSTPAQAAYVDSLDPGYLQLLDEDLDNLAWIQRGVRHGDRPLLTLTSQERRILHFRETLAAWMA